LNSVYEAPKIGTTLLTTPSIPDWTGLSGTNTLASLLAKRDPVTPSTFQATSGLLGIGRLVPPVTKPTILTGGLGEATLKTEKVLTHWEVRWPLVERYILRKLIL